MHLFTEDEFEIGVRHPHLSDHLCCREACDDETFGFLEEGWFTMHVSLEVQDVDRRPNGKAPLFGTKESEVVSNSTILLLY